jgi:hypothetical protein
MIRRWFAVALLLMALPLAAGTLPGSRSWRVTLAPHAGTDSAAAAKRLAAMYRGELETPVDAEGTFLTRSLMSREGRRRVALVARAQERDSIRKRWKPHEREVTKMRVLSYGDDADAKSANIDHAIAKSRNGNSTLPNAQNTCRTCNLKKAVKDTLEFLRKLVL